METTVGRCLCSLCQDQGAVARFAFETAAVVEVQAGRTEAPTIMRSLLATVALMQATRRFLLAVIHVISLVCSPKTEQ